MPEAPRSWEVRLAAALVGVGAVVGAAMVIIALMLMAGDPGFLFAVLPIIFLVLSVAGVGIATFSLALAVRVRRAEPGARMQVMVSGGALVVSGLFVAAESPLAAVVLLPYGGALLWLMATPAAARELGPFIAVPAGRPWFGSRASSRAPSGSPAGEFPPWWETWRAGLRQGMPRGDLLLAGLALLLFVVGLVGLPLGLALFRAGALASLVLMMIGAALVWVVERRMKARLARR
jgi:hypothetical protein